MHIRDYKSCHIALKNMFSIKEKWLHKTHMCPYCIEMVGLSFILIEASMCMEVEPWRSHNIVQNSYWVKTHLLTTTYQDNPTNRILHTYTWVVCGQVHVWIHKKKHPKYTCSKEIGLYAHKFC